MPEIKKGELVADWNDGNNKIWEYAVITTKKKGITRGFWCKTIEAALETEGIFKPEWKPGFEGYGDILGKRVIKLPKDIEKAKMKMAGEML
jgi:hypothetical protein